MLLRFYLQIFDPAGIEIQRGCSSLNILKIYLNLEWLIILINLKFKVIFNKPSV